jgi:hypothetical protein
MVTLSTMIAAAATGNRVRRSGARFLALASAAAIAASRRLEDDGSPSLQGDRAVEWSFCLARLSEGTGTTLDFGADTGLLALAAAQRGHEVVALDRLPPALEYVHPTFSSSRLPTVASTRSSTARRLSMSGSLADMGAPPDPKAISKQWRSCAIFCRQRAGC